MKKTKVIIGIALVAGFASLISFAPPPPSPIPPPPSPNSYEQEPPIALHYWVQQLKEPLVDGSNVVMSIEYLQDETLPKELTIYYADDGKESFHDDGVAPDAVAGDYIYTTYLQEDISKFESEITLKEKILVDKGEFVNWKGHEGEVITKIPHFDLVAFNDFKQTEVDALLLNAADCNTAILKQNSLFITDLSVVQAQATTYNPSTSSGNPVGAWTFGTLIKQMQPTGAVAGSAKAFLHSWLQCWTDNTIVNDQTVQARQYVRQFLITPWIARALVGTSFEMDVDAMNDCNKNDNWSDTYWPLVDEEALLENAPFRLTAIVNRLDVMGNAGYASALSNAGETRFIFTLVEPIDASNHWVTPAGGTTLSNLIDATNGINIGSAGLGMVPRNGQNDIAGGIGFLDWEGMNLILEYRNPFSSRCAIKNFAQQWLDLSGYTLGSGDYITALQAITDQVTAQGATANAGLPNGSGLMRIRTNERIFAPSFGGPTDWAASNWEMRQFEINAITNMVTEAPMTNTPIATANNQQILNMAAASGTPDVLSGSPNGIPFNYATFFYDASNNPVSQDGTVQGGWGDAILDQYGKPLVNWITAPIHKQRVLAGNFNLPVSSGDLKLAGSAILQGDYASYWDLDWDPSVYPSGTNYDEAKQLRREVSLNTCQGCHAAETKTMFTHVRPLPYDESADYWSPNLPSTTHGQIDGRFHSGYDDQGYYVDPVLGHVPNYPASTLISNTEFVNVSAFLTGRTYATYDVHTNTFGPTYQDDNTNPTEDGSDGLFTPSLAYPTLLYYVNYPSNQGLDTKPGTQQVPRGYNDLQMRQDKLCQLLNTSCSPHDGSVVLQLVNAVHITPLPFGGH